MKNIDLLLYSIGQNCFHHDSLADHINENHRYIKKDENYDDYKVIYATETWDEDRGIIDAIKKSIRKEVN